MAIYYSFLFHQLIIIIIIIIIIIEELLEWKSSGSGLENRN
jgi:hypothetical protein